MTRKLFTFLPVCILSLFSCTAEKQKNGSKTYESAFAAYSDSLPVAQRQALYANIVSRLSAQRENFSKQLQAASSASAKNKIISGARAYLFKTICDSLVVCWYGTPWNFNGTTTKPGEGNIACGYFVTTVLQDAGFNLDRIWFAQQAASVLIQKTCVAKNISIHGNSKPEDEAKRFDERDDGLYLIGLDNHVGFVRKRNNNVTIVHSCPWPYNGVGSEKFGEAKIILESHYFMAGDLLNSDEVIEGWINGKEISKN